VATEAASDGGTTDSNKAESELLYNRLNGIISVMAFCFFFVKLPCRTEIWAQADSLLASRTPEHPKLGILFFSRSHARSMLDLRAVGGKQ
jgi:hypothetical protein